MLGDWADSDSDDEFSQFGGLGSGKSKSRSSGSASAAPSGSFMFVSSGVYDLASGKKEGEEGAKPSAMQVDEAPDQGAKPKKKSALEKPEPSLGAWERYTKGVGSKMLKKMGWSGKGLGVQESGMVEPIKVVTRTAGTGLDVTDYMGVKKAQYRQSEMQEEAAKEDEEKPAEETRKGQWKKDAPKLTPSAPKIPKVVYKTKEEYEREYGANEQKQLVIDMRAPQFATESHVEVPALATPQFMPELRHNLTHLVDLRVNAIHSLVKKRHYSEEQIRQLKGEEAGVRHSLEAQKSDISYLEILKSRLDELKQMATSEDKVDFLPFFADLKDTFSVEYEKYQLDSLIFHYVFPRLSYEMLSWRPLYKPGHGVESMLQWKALLEPRKPVVGDAMMMIDDYDDGFGVSQRLREEQGRTKTKKTLDTYSRMVYELIVPKLRTALAEWDVHNPDPALDLLAIWKPALTSIAYNWLLYHVIGEKLKTAVSDYNVPALADSLEPSSSSQLPLDTWILPWLPIMGAHNIPVLMEDIRRKLQQITSTTRADVAVALLKPFEGVLDRHNWAQLLARGVLSRIETLLRQVEIEPAEQQMEAWNEAMKWKRLVSVEAFAMVLSESGFWKKWFSILGQWLHQEDVDFEQVQQWYSSWKAQLPKDLQSSALVQPQFRSALQLMLAASNGQLPPLSQFVPVKINVSQHQQQLQQQQLQAPQKPSSGEVPSWQEVSLKDLLESAAEEAGVLFMSTGRKHEGNPIYKFGKLLVYMERDIVYSGSGATAAWKPISIHNLIHNCK